MKVYYILFLGLVTLSFQQQPAYHRAFWAPNYVAPPPEAYYNYQAVPRQMSPFSFFSSPEADYDSGLISPSPVVPGQVYWQPQQQAARRSSTYWSPMQQWYYASNRYKSQEPMSYIPVRGDDEVQPENDWTQQIQSRAPASAQQRFFFNNGVQLVMNSSSNAFRNPFAQTYAVVSTSTVNVTSIVSCVPSSQFASGLSSAACRKRRKALERFRLTDEEDDILSPSTVEKLETTAMDPFKSYEERNARFNELIASSKDDLYIANDEEDSEVETTSSRKKRLFFNALNFAYTTTITSYSLLTTISTKRVTLLSGSHSSLITCIPNNMIVCLS